MDPTPLAVRLDPSRDRLEIDWQDGHRSAYCGAYLRLVCPCASCRGHAPGQVEPPAWEGCRDVRVTGAEIVGAYALRFALTDGHDTGIYAYEHLRARCPSGDPARDEVGRPRGG